MTDDIKCIVDTKVSAINSRDTDINNMLNSIIHKIEHSLVLGITPDVEYLKLFISIHTEFIKCNKSLYDFIMKKIAHYIENNIDVINEYELLCDDKRFEHHILKSCINFNQPQLPPTTVDNLYAMENEADKKFNLPGVAVNRGVSDILLRKKKQFNEGDLVVAKDKLNNWYYSLVLVKHTDPGFPFPWYYIHFFGKKKIFREWISEPMRIKYCNPKFKPWQSRPYKKTGTSSAPTTLK